MDFPPAYRHGICQVCDLLLEILEVLGKLRFLGFDFRCVFRAVRAIWIQSTSAPKRGNIVLVHGEKSRTRSVFHP
jgi:hypothetical protein